MVSFIDGTFFFSFWGLHVPQFNDVVLGVDIRDSALWPQSTEPGKST